MYFICLLKGPIMELLVIDTIVCSSTGISFSIVWCDTKLIIWYQSDVFLPPSKKIKKVNNGVIIDGKLYPITIFNITPFNKVFWHIIKNMNECPGGKIAKGNLCPESKSCCIAMCPYGLRKITPLSK